MEYTVAPIKAAQHCNNTEISQLILETCDDQAKDRAWLKALERQSAARARPSIARDAIAITLYSRLKSL